MFTQKELNKLQRNLLELMKDYDRSVLNNEGKANVVEDSLSRMTMCSFSHVE